MSIQGSLCRIEVLGICLGEVYLGLIAVVHFIFGKPLSSITGAYMSIFGEWGGVSLPTFSLTVVFFLYVFTYFVDSWLCTCQGRLNEVRSQLLGVSCLLLHEGPRSGIQVMRLGSRHMYPWVILLVHLFSWQWSFWLGWNGVCKVCICVSLIVISVSSENCLHTISATSYLSDKHSLCYIETF